MGINSTPVIDWTSQTLFVIAYVNANPAVNPVSPTYFIHALDLVTLKDKVPPLKVAASHTLTDGSAFAFNATYEKQRAALLFANNTVYAAFTSFLRRAPIQSRGWLLGWSWNGTTLTVLPANQLDDRQPGSSSTQHFLSSIWMSGAGPASDESGNVFFSTGNSDGSLAKTSTWTDTAPCSGIATGTVPTNVPCSNIQESVVELNGHLTGIGALFSPNAQYGLLFSQHPYDGPRGLMIFGSGGVPSCRAAWHLFLLAAIAGQRRKIVFAWIERALAWKFLQLHQYRTWGCSCAPSYFTGPDGVGRIVASQGRELCRPSRFQRTSLTPEGKHQILSLTSDKTPASSPRFRATAAVHLGIAQIRQSSGRFHVPKRPLLMVLISMHFREWR